MWDSVELRELRVFLTLAEELHFGRTAERLMVSQSRVSQAVRTLEGRVGGSLFDRTSRTVSLTTLGEELHVAIGPAYEELRQAFNEARGMATGVLGTVRIGIYTPISLGPYMVQIVRKFEERHPGCNVVFVNVGLEGDPLENLRTGRIDMLAIRLPLGQPDITVGPILSREPRVLLVAAGDPLAARESIVYDDVSDRLVSDLPSFPREMMDAKTPPVTASGQRLRRIANRTVEEMMMRVAMGVQVHPTVESWLEHHAHPGIAAVPISDMPPSESGLVWLTALRSVRVQSFVSAAVDVLSGTELRQRD